MIIVHLLVLVVSMFVLIKAADYFVDSSSSVARVLGISQFVIGLTLVAIGTSLPELASSVVASLKGHSAMAIGNVIGSNIANTLLVIGAAASISSIKITREMFRRDDVVMLFTTFLFYFILLGTAFFAFAGQLVVVRIFAGLLMIIFFAYLLFVARSKKHYAAHEDFEDFLVYLIGAGFIRELSFWKKGDELHSLHKKHKANRESIFLRRKLWHHLLIAFFSCVSIILSAKFLIGEAILLSELFNISGGVIGMTIIALGTSLPELTVSVVAARKGLGNMAIGNILGSNIANILLVGGVSLLISPVVLAQRTLLYTLPFLLVVSFVLVMFTRTGLHLRKREGFALLVLYVLFLVLIYRGILV